jgi:hypothetical protein
MTKFIVVLKLVYFMHRWHSGQTDLQENKASELRKKNLSTPSEVCIILTQVFRNFSVRKTIIVVAQCSQADGTTL